MNDKFIQIVGPFDTTEDIVNYIKQNFDSELLYIKKCGIQTLVGNKVKINDVTFEIGKTGILEFENVKITSIRFMQQESAETRIDCILE